MLDSVVLILQDTIGISVEGMKGVFFGSSILSTAITKNTGNSSLRSRYRMVKINELFHYSQGT